MEFYQEIKLLPTMEFSVNILWSKIYEQLHIKLAELQNNEKEGEIGIAFPDYCNGEEKTGLGHSMRIFAPIGNILRIWMLPILCVGIGTILLQIQYTK